MIRILALLVAQLCIPMALSELGSVKHGLLYELIKCLIPPAPITMKEPESNGIAGKNAIQVLGGLGSCWKTAFHTCHEYKYRQTEWPVRRNYLCGGVNSGTKQPYSYDFKVYSKYGMLFHFIKFNFPCSTWCQKAQLFIDPNGESQNRLTYCGKRVPWKLAFWDSSNNIGVYVLTKSIITEDFSFILEYTAIDRASPEMTMTEEIFVTFLKGDKRSIPLQYSPFRNSDKHFRHDFVSYFFASHVLDMVCIDLIPNKYTQLYNGPGRMSEFVSIPWIYYGRQFYYCFRSFLGSVWHSSNEQDSIRWDTRTNLYQHGYCKTYNFINERHFIARDNGDGLHCVWEIQQYPEEIRLEQVRFYGFNMFMFMTEAGYRDLDYFRICQYGGLYILYKDTSGQWNIYEKRTVIGNAVTYLSLCTNIYNKPSIHLPLDRDITTTYLVFTTFKNYSAGSASISFRNSDCKGYHYEYYPCHDNLNVYIGLGNLDRPPYYFMNHNYRDFWGTSDTLIPSCKAIWLMLNVDWDSRVEYNCQVNYTFQYLINVFMVGPQHIYIDNWIIPLTHHKAIKHTDHYNFHMTATVLKDFPVDMTELEQTVIVHRDQPKSAYLQHLRELRFSTNNSLEDMHATIIKIQLLQNLICTDTQSTHNIEAHIPHLFITAERITSRIKHHIHSRIPLKQPYCMQVLKNTSCVTNGTSSAITVIDQVYLHHTYGYAAEEIETTLNITMIDEQQCLQYCTLDISLWENLQIYFLSTNKFVRHFQWKKVKYLIWRVLPTEGGFRLRINRTCSASCTHICEVAVNFTYVNSTRNCLTGSFFKGKPKQVRFGTWEDAFDYCGKTPLQLLSTYGNNKQQHDFSGMMPCFLPWNEDPGVDLVDHAFFAGLHKSHKVIQSSSKY